MKKIFLTVTIAAGISTLATAQTFIKGTNVLSVNIGLGSSLGYNNSGSPAMSANFERGVWTAGEKGVISLGAYVGYKNFKNSGNYGSGYNFSQKWSYTIVGIRSAYHYTGVKSDKIDVYGGAMISYNILKYSYKDNGGCIAHLLPVAMEAAQVLPLM